MAESFASLLRTLLRSHGGTKRAFAEAIGVTPSTLSHFLVARRVAVSTDTCLRIAEVGRVSASRVLRAAHRGEVAKRLEALYGEAAKFQRVEPARFTTQEWTFIEALRRIRSPRQQRAVVTIALAIAALYDGNDDVAPKPRPRSRARSKPVVEWLAG